MRNIVKPVIAVAFFLALLKAADSYFYSITTKFHTDSAQVIMRMRNQQFNYLMLGSSRTETIFNTRIIDSLTGLRGYNMGLNGSEFAESYLLLDQVLKHGNRVSVLFIQSDIFQMSARLSYSYPFHEYRYLPYLNDKDVSAMIKRENGLLKYAVWKYIPFWKYAEFNTEYNVLDMVTHFKNRPYNYNTNGFNAVKVLAHGDDFADSRYTNLPLNRDKFIADQQNNDDLKKIITLAKAHGVKVFLIQPPVYFKISEWAARYSIENTAAESHVIAVNYLNDSISAKGHLFKDFTHLNGEGATVFSASIAQEISGLVRGAN